MGNRYYLKQPDHDSAVRAARDIYQQHGVLVWINPDGEKNKECCGYYIDVIAAANPQATMVWVIEIETEDSVNDTEALGQWKEYDRAYTSWKLAVPTTSKSEAERLIQKHGITHCEVVTWTQNYNGTCTFSGLPGLN